MSHKDKKLLYESFDRDLNDSELDRLNEALSDSDELRRDKNAIKKIRELVSSRDEQNFEPFFADRVMNKIQIERAGKESLEFLENIALLFRPLAIAATVIIITIVSFNLFKGEQVNLENALVIPDITIADAYNPIMDLNEE